MMGPIMYGPNELAPWWAPAAGVILGVALPVIVYMICG